MRRAIVILVVLGAATRVHAQPLPELPPPRPVTPARPAPPPARPLSRDLARLAIDSNRYKPVCDPEMPVPGLWGGATSAQPRSWQEYLMAGRDCLAWIFTKPTCAAGMQAPSNASFYDWCRHLLSFETAPTTKSPTRVATP